MHILLLQEQILLGCELFSVDCSYQPCGVSFTRIERTEPLVRAKPSLRQEGEKKSATANMQANKWGVVKRIADPV